MADEETITTAAALDLADRTAVLTDEVIGQLKEAIGQRPASEIAALRVFELVLALRGPMAAVSNLQAIAKATLQALEELGLAEVAAPAASAAAVNVEVKLPTSIGDMSLRELLDHLVAHPEQYSELAIIIAQNPSVIAASAKTPNWVVPMSNGTTDINVTATLEYVTTLAGRFSVPQRTLSGAIRPITLPRAFGQNELALMHPFTFDPITGPDSLGFDWGILDEELHKALLWAHATAHELWPNQLDLFSASTEVFQDPLPPRWQRILDDYRAACAENPGNAVTSRYHTDESIALIQAAKAGGTAPFGGAAPEAAHDDTWYRGQLEAACLRSIGSAGGSVRKENCVIASINSGGGNVYLTNVVVLDTISTNGGNLHGTIFMPSSGNVRTSGGNDRSTTYSRSWKQLYEKALELGIIEP